MAVAAALSWLVAASATVLLTVAARRRTGAHRQALLLVATAAGIALAGLLVGLGVLLHAAPHWAHEQGHRTSWATAVSVGTAASGLVFLAGLVRLPGVVGSVSAALRLALDGVMVAAALCFVGWVLVSEPTRMLGGATPTACTPILLATVGAALAAGVGPVAACRSAAPRAGSSRSPSPSSG